MCSYINSSCSCVTLPCVWMWFEIQFLWQYMYWFFNSSSQPALRKLCLTLKWDDKDGYTHYILADITNGFQRALFHHFRAAWIGDILCEQAYQVAPLTSGQFGTRDVSDALRSRTGSNCFRSQRLQDLKTEIVQCGFEKMKCVSLMTNFCQNRTMHFGVITVNTVSATVLVFHKTVYLKWLKLQTN